MSCISYASFCFRPCRIRASGPPDVKLIPAAEAAWTSNSPGPSSCRDVGAPQAVRGARMATQQ